MLPSFTFGQRLGVFLIIEASLLSGASVTFILCYALYRRLRKTLGTRKNNAHWQRPSDATSSILFLNLMLADLIQAIGSIPNIKWMRDGAVEEGTLCTVQAVLKQVGIVGVSMTSLAIALHTFSILVLRRRGPRHLPKYAVIGIWVFAAFELGIANLVHRNERYYGNTGYWCWILPRFKTEQIMTEYLWVWFSGFSMIILYSIMFAVVRGWFVIDHGIRWYNNPHRGTLDTDSDEVKSIKTIANSMLFYPAVYMICVLPNTLARWLAFSETKPPPYQATLFANAIYGLSGLFDLILFFLTRPKIVVGPQPVVPKGILFPTHGHHDSMRYSSQKVAHLSQCDYGVAFSDIEKYGRGEPSFGPRTPSRTMNRPRSSYDLPSVNCLPSSPTRNTHYRGASSISGVDPVVDIG